MMAEEDFEIEYLDEDEDLINQYTKAAPAQLTIENDEDGDIENKLKPLLIERKSVDAKRKYKSVHEEDSDYDPQEDIVAMQLEKDKLSAKKKRKQPPRKTHKQTPLAVTPKKTIIQYTNTARRKSEPPKPVPEVKAPIEKEVVDLKERKKAQIQIPDYEDPLCMPVKAYQESEEDIKKLKRWNKVCLEQFRKCDRVFAPDSGSAVKSSRTVVLRNIQNKISGINEMTVWSKTIVENEKGENKSDIFQYVLPRYYEKNALELYPMHKQDRKHTRKHIFEALLSKEENKDGEVLVVYKPKEAISAVYKLIEKPLGDDSGRVKMLMKELTCCKICAPCYQCSWRGARKVDHANIPCSLCGRSHVSVYNLLSHLKSHHANGDVARRRRDVAKVLATVVEYHYRCKICREQFTSIKLLRQHVLTHKGKEEFKCEIGNHMTT